jgi:ubiquinone/menaquinone biosynthesis C-methylase UbiE
MHKSEKFWDNESSRYEKRAIKNTDAYKKTLDNTKKHLNANDVVLECGCGTGTMAIELAGSVTEISALDISSKMIAIAEQKAVAAKISNVHFSHSTIFDERFQKRSFNVVLAFNVLHLLEDTQKVFQRVNELLVPGGLFISGTVCLGENKLWTVLSFILSKTRLVPHVRSFRISELEDSVTKEEFQLIETAIFFPKPPRRFIVARKR